MAEVVNISKKANYVLNYIKDELKWEVKRPKDLNWKCVNQEQHNKKTHPSDIVIRYPHPYSKKHIIFQTDLKSYKKESFSNNEIEKWLTNLASSVDCANASEEWRKRYIEDSIDDYDIDGLIFAFNHDYLFPETTNPHKWVQTIAPKIKLNGPFKINILFPNEINFLVSMVQHIKSRRGEEGEKSLPKRSECGFFYPDMSLNRTRGDGLESLTMDSLGKDWIIFRYKKDMGYGTLVFYKGNGAFEEDFIILFDYLSYSQLLHDIKIEVICWNSFDMASNLFINAQDSYKTYFPHQSDIIENIEFDRLNLYRLDLRETDIGNQE